MITLLQRCDRLPPFIVRLVAHDRYHVRKMTLREIAQRSGISLWAVRRIARKRSWATVDLETIEAFTTACGVDLMRQQNTLLILRNALNSSHGWKSFNRKHWPAKRAIAILTGAKA